ncbi:hypothetical protein ACFO0N_01540 [Halobium salinum]|uniref:Sensor histidine kinase n=1 Tax=Halobium salinum TaxID=1364940 RepID=A0ABD5P701_9EURY|nr:hypothetical protein [Halobium salinum]
MRGPDTPTGTVHSFRETVLAWTLLFAAVNAVLLAVSYPLLVAAVVVAATLTAAATVLVVDGRRRAGRTRTVCLDRVGVCVEA